MSTVAEEVRNVSAAAPPARPRHPLPLWVRAGDLAAEAIVWAILAGGFVTYGYASHALARGLAFSGCAALGVWAAVGVGAGRWRASGLRPAMWILGVFAALALWTGLQLIPAPSGVVAALSPAWGEAMAEWSAVGIEAPRRLPLALDSAKAAAAWNQMLASAMFFAGVSALTTRRPIAARLLLGVVAMSLIEGFWGLGNYFIGGGRAYGAIFNPNHHAAFTLMGLPVFFALILRFRRLKEIDVETDVSLLSDRFIFFFLLGVFGILAWVVSFSRGSLIFGGGLLAVWIGFEAWMRRKESAREGALEISASRLVFGGVALALVILALGWLFLAASAWEGFAKRGLEDDLTGPGRAGLWRAAWIALMKSPWVGLGLGGVEHALNQYSQSPMTRAPIWAHNDYLQLLAEIGFPASLAIWLLVFGALLSVARTWATSSRGETWGAGLPRRAAMIGVAVTLGHAMVDFHLRLPLVGFVTLILLALACSPGAVAVSPRALTRFLDLS